MKLSILLAIIENLRQLLPDVLSARVPSRFTNAGTSFVHDLAKGHVRNFSYADLVFLGLSLCFLGLFVRSGYIPHPTASKEGSREKNYNFCSGFPYGWFRVVRWCVHYGAMEHGAQSI